jgi:hypothetical protein
MRHDTRAKTIVRRLCGSIRSSAFEDGMDAELQLHLELEAEALAARGMDPRAARLTASRAAAIDPMCALRAD